MKKKLTGGGDALDVGVRPMSPVKHIIESVKVASAGYRAMTL